MSRLCYRLACNATCNTDRVYCTVDVKDKNTTVSADRDILKEKQCPVRCHTGALHIIFSFKPLVEHSLLSPVSTLETRKKIFVLCHNVECQSDFAASRSIENEL